MAWDWTAALELCAFGLSEYANRMHFSYAHTQYLKVCLLIFCFWEGDDGQNKLIKRFSRSFGLGWGVGRAPMHNI